MAHLINEHAAFTPERRDFKPRHDQEGQALDAVRAAIRDGDTASLRILSMNKLPYGWPERFRPYLGAMALGAKNMLEYGDRNTRSSDGFNGFAAHQPATPAPTPPGNGYRSIVEEMLAETPDTHPAAAADTDATQVMNRWAIVDAADPETTVQLTLSDLHSRDAPTEVLTGLPLPAQQY